MTARGRVTTFKICLLFKNRFWPSYRDFTVFLAKPHFGPFRPILTIMGVWPKKPVKSRYEGQNPIFEKQTHFKSCYEYSSGHFERDFRSFWPHSRTLSQNYTQNWPWVIYPKNGQNSRIPQLGATPESREVLKILNPRVKLVYLVYFWPPLSHICDFRSKFWDVWKTR